MINGDRCVWVVTVDAPLAINGPEGYDGPSTAPVYTVVLDEATGLTVIVIASAVLNP
jgi:hypothetical protein